MVVTRFDDDVVAMQWFISKIMPFPKSDTHTRTHAHTHTHTHTHIKNE
jgi:hypothetical protein